MLVKTDAVTPAPSRGYPDHERDHRFLFIQRSKISFDKFTSQTEEYAGV